MTPSSFPRSRASNHPSGVQIETTVALPGGVLYTKRAGTSTDVWSYPNTHGDVAATRVNGTVTAFNWDPYGNPVGTVPDNSAGTADWGWLGQHQRTLDHPSGLNPVIEMGARVYQPDTGRFQQTDPIEDGTTTNPYSNGNTYTYTDTYNYGNTLSCKWNGIKNIL